MADFEFKNPIVSFPDSSSIKNVKMVVDRIGSVGGEVLKRFTIILDYADRKMYLKKIINSMILSVITKAELQFSIMVCNGFRKQFILKWLK